MWFHQTRLYISGWLSLGHRQIGKSHLTANSIQCTADCRKTSRNSKTKLYTVRSLLRLPQSLTRPQDRSGLVGSESLQQECSYDRAVLRPIHSLLLQIRKGSRFYAKIVRSPVQQSLYHVYVAVTGRKRTYKIQTAIQKRKTTSSCGSEIYCACSSIIHKGTQKIWSDFNKAF